MSGGRDIIKEVQEEDLQEVNEIIEKHKRNVTENLVRHYSQGMDDSLDLLKFSFMEISKDESDRAFNIEEIIEIIQTSRDKIILHMGRVPDKRAIDSAKKDTDV